MCQEMRFVKVLSSFLMAMFLTVSPCQASVIITGGDSLCSPSDSVKARIVRRGIIIAGEPPCVRAMEPFSGTTARAAEYARVVNSYKAAFGDSVAVYCMPVPTAVEFYCPDTVREKTRRERPVLDAMFNSLAADVVPVDIYDVLKEHSGENIYSRTDHHWAPLGAYYAAMKFAAAAEVPFVDLSTYDKKIVRNYVGSMYTFTKDIAVKNSPEDFVYYVPRGVDYSTTFINYKLGRNNKVIGESEPQEHDFFIKYPDGSRGAYCTFMGGDSRTVKVVTGVKNGRRLMVLKDSYGNAVPGYLFHSFEEIHVLDFRYFTKSVRAYVKDNEITDVLFANNLTHACSLNTSKAYAELLAR